MSVLYNVYACYNLTHTVQHLLYPSDCLHFEIILSQYLPCMCLSPVANWKGEIDKDVRQQQPCSENGDVRDALGESCNPKNRAGDKMLRY